MAKVGDVSTKDPVASAAMGESFSSTNSTDRDGHKKVTSFWPPSEHTDEDDVTHKFSIAARIWLVLEDPAMGVCAKWMSLIMMVLILASCVGFVLASIPGNMYIEEDMTKCEKDKYTIDVDCSNCWDGHDGVPIYAGKCSVCSGQAVDAIVKVCEPQEEKIFVTAETICIYCFTLDYLLRIGTVASVGVDRWGGEDRMKSCFSKVYNYSTGWLNLVDLIAIMPFWIEVAAGQGVPLGFLRVLRLARVFRIFKLGKYNEGMSLFARTLHASIPALSLLCFFVLIGVVLFGSIIYFVEGGTYVVDASVCPESLGYACYVRPNSYSGEDMEQSPFVSIPYSFYWVMVTMTTVGYGDQYPQTGLGKFITICCMLCGILTLALPITVLGSNFTAEYEALHGDSDEDEKAAEEEKFWEHFASLVASSMQPSNAPINSQATRDRLKMMMIDNAGGALADATSPNRPSGKNVPTISVSGANLGAISELEKTIAQLQRTVQALRGGGDMLVEELDSASPSPVNFQQQTKVSKNGMSGAVSNIGQEGVVHRCRVDVKPPLVTSGNGSLPTYFDIFSPKKLKNKSQQRFEPNKGIIVDLAKVEKDLNLSNFGDDIAEMDRMVGFAPSIKATSGKDSPALDLRRGSIGGGAARMKLKQLGKSLSFGNRLMKVKKYTQNLGAVSRKLDIEVVGAKGITRDEAAGAPLSFTVVAGGTQFETNQAEIENDAGGTLFGDKFEYEVPLSTHSGNMLVKNIEIIAHFGEKIVGVAVVPLTSVCGNEREFRLMSSNSSYLSSRINQKANSVGFAGTGRVKVVLAWGKIQKEEHKFGTSFGKFLNDGGKFKVEEGSFRKSPVYPKVKVKKRRMKKGTDLVVHDSGEAFFFEEVSSGNSLVDKDVVVGELVFPSCTSDDEVVSYTSPTESPGRSDTDKDSFSQGDNNRAEEERNQEREIRKSNKQNYKKVMVEEFLHNNKQTPKAKSNTGVAKGVGAFFGSSSKIAMQKYEEV